MKSQLSFDMLKSSLLESEKMGTKSKLQKDEELQCLSFMTMMFKIHPLHD